MEHYNVDFDTFAKLSRNLLNKIQEKGNQISSVYSDLNNTENSIWRTPWGSSAYQKSENQAELKFQDIMYLTTSVDIGWNSFKDGIELYNAKLFDKAL